MRVTSKCYNIGVAILGISFIIVEIFQFEKALIYAEQNKNRLNQINHPASITHAEDFEPNKNGYDFVTVIHEDDMHIFIDYGYTSWLQYFSYSSHSRVFAICTNVAYEKITKLQQQDEHNKFDNLVLVREDIFPFTLDDLKGGQWANKPTWKYQQLLKIYSYQVLSIYDPPIRKHFLIIDSDTIAIRAFRFIQHSRGDNSIGKPIYNIAAEESGAFMNDALVKEPLIKEVFPNLEIVPSFSNSESMHYTSITHMMMFDGLIMNEFLNYLSEIHNEKPVWLFLNSLRSVLSEWELYMAWIMHHHREEIIFKQIPYVNWGNITQSNLEWAKESTDVYYVSAHDEWNENNICCVNSEWSKLQGSQIRFSCKCCPIHDCDHIKIDCHVLGIARCNYDDEDGFITFQEEEKNSS